MNNLVALWKYDNKFRIVLQLRIIGTVLFLSFINAQAEPNYDDYKIQFPSPIPTNGREALDTYPSRYFIVLENLACGQEEGFLDEIARNPFTPNDFLILKTGEEMLHRVLGKMNFSIQELFISPEFGHGMVRWDRLKKCGQVGHRGEKIIKLSSDDNIDDLKSRFSKLFGNDCVDVIYGDFTHVSLIYSLSSKCLRNELNNYLSKVFITGIPGSSDVPCFPNFPVPIALTEGEWDVYLKELTRIYYLNEGMGRRVLTEDVRFHLRDKLLSLYGPPGQESYNLGECGNQEKYLGTPEELADERAWLPKALDDIGDALGWLAKWLIRLAALLVAAVAAFAALSAIVGGTFVGAAIATLVAIGAVAFTIGEIPESENHLLMIESSRYLKNQIILDELPPDYSSRRHIEDDQLKEREWLLKRMQRIVKEDFVEYNARPYQRYSLAAIRNLADFSKDNAIKIAARNVLDLAAAKMALGSNQGRRIVPFRRLMKAIQQHIEPNEHSQNGLFDLNVGADHQIGLMLAYTGQTQQTPNGKISTGAVQEMSFAVTSGYFPPEAILDIAIDKQTPYQQYIKHDAVEIYSSTGGFLLTAGGIQSGPSSTIELAGVSAGKTILGVKRLYNLTDLGAAVPTTLMLSSGNGRSSLEDFIRIEGPRQQHDKDNASYDNNLCVYKGFACGLNIKTPHNVNNPSRDMERCFVNSRFGSGQWRFFDSESCVAFNDYCKGGISAGVSCNTKQLWEQCKVNGGNCKPPQRVMIALYLNSCQGDQTGECNENLGLFEAVYNPDVDFEKFQLRIINNNPTAAWPSLTGMMVKRKILSGTYTSFTGEKIVFNTSGHQLDPERTGIISVNNALMPNISKWPRATSKMFGSEKKILSIDGKTGMCTFTHPRTQHGFDINMSDWNNPQRRDF